MSGNYDPTNMRDDRHPLRALGMAFGQRQAMDQEYEARAPQYQQAPLAAQLTATPNPLMGQQGFGGAAASPLVGAGNMGQQIGKGALGLYEWARGGRGTVPMSSLMPAPSGYNQPEGDMFAAGRSSGTPDYGGLY